MAIRKIRIHAFCNLIGGFKVSSNYIYVPYWERNIIRRDVKYIFFDYLVLLRTFFSQHEPAPANTLLACRTLSVTTLLTKHEDCNEGAEGGGYATAGDDTLGCRVQKMECT